jgi:hypothetical protein
MITEFSHSVVRLAPRTVDILEQIRDGQPVDGAQRGVERDELCDLRSQSRNLGKIGAAWAVCCPSHSTMRLHQLDDDTTDDLAVALPESPA